LKKYLLDSNVFDYLLDNQINISGLKKAKFYSTNIQWSELNNTPDVERKNQLLEIYQVVNPKKILLKSGIMLDAVRWDDEQPWIDEISHTATKLKGNTKASWRDALIGEIANKSDLTLVTADHDFFNKCKSENISVILPSEMITELGLM
jgi:predicted nucleic acid-binding protein